MNRRCDTVELSEDYLVSQSDIYEKLRTSVYKSVRNRLSRSPVTTDEEVVRVIEEAIVKEDGIRSISAFNRSRMRKELFNRIRRLDVLSDLLDDDSVTEIMINGTDEIFIEKEGHIVSSHLRFDSKEKLIDVIGRIASGVNRTVNMSSPILDARLSDGSRVNIVLDPVAINGPILTIRRFPVEPINADKLIRYGSVTREVLEFVEVLVRSKYNILISGGTGSGKTTFLNVCTGYIPKDERIITIEDSAEIKIMGIKNLVRLETRNATSEGSSEITIRDLIRSALRMRPDRIIVGEVRGEEAIDMLQAFSVGQDGSLSTIHANHAEDALYRLETMIMLSTQIPIEALRRQIASGVDIIIQLGRLRDGSRHLLEIREVIGMNGTNVDTLPLYKYIDSSEKVEGQIGSIVKFNKLVRTEKFERSGIKYEL